MPSASRRAAGPRGTTRLLAIALAAAGLTAAVATPAVAEPADGRSAGGGNAGFPETITLPNDAVAGDLGFQPEGIAVRGVTAFAGSLVDGSVVTADLRTGAVSPLVVADGDPAVGLELVGRLLLVAGGPSGEIRAYDNRTGDEVAVYDVPGAGFINDITVAGGTAYFTDSQRAVIYAASVDGKTLGEPREIALAGDFELAAPGSFNGNGIAALDARTVILAQSTDPDGSGSALYTVDTATGVAARIPIAGGDVTAADGLLLKGRTLYVVQNRENSIAELTLSRDGAAATFVRTITDPDIAVTTTIDLGPRGSLYGVNARFGTPPSDAVPYEIVRIAR
ncbi:MAG: hypothetical protein RI885_486 [Actinomycetota bacterium]|jgi:hypothetical protein